MIESRWRARFSAPVQNGPGAQSASYIMGTESFPVVKRPGRGVDHPPSSSAEVEGRVELYICSPSESSWPVLGRTLPLFYLHYYSFRAHHRSIHKPFPRYYIIRISRHHTLTSTSYGIIYTPHFILHAVADPKTY